MATVLSLITFIIITILGFKYAYVSGSCSVQSPFNTKYNIHVTSRQRFVLLLLSVVIIQAGSFSAIILLVWIILLLSLSIKYSTSLKGSRLFNFYGLYLVWLLISIFFSPEPIFGLRVFSKYLFPFLVLIVVSSISISDVLFLKYLKIAFRSLITVNILYVISTLDSGLFNIYNSIFWLGTSLMDVNSFTLVIGLILYQITKKKKYLYFLIILILIPILTSVRTGLIGLGVTLLAISFFKYKWRALPFCLIIIVGLVVSFLYVPGIRDKMFKGAFNNAESIINASEKITLDNIETSGRSDAWKWSLEKFYKGHEYIGSGLGNLQAVFYSGNHPFGRLKVIHNDYIQILCDIGLIGLILYLLVIISFVVHSFIIYNNKRNPLTARYAAFIAGTSLCGIMACAFTDNVINYSLITLSYPYVFFGFALSFKNRKLIKKL